MAALKGISQEVRGRHIQLDQDLITIGHSESNTIVVDNDTVSGQHCSIVWDGKKYMLRDLGSTNGTRVNSKSVKETFLKPKDIIQVGFIEFMFDAESSTGDRFETRSHTFTQMEEEVGPTEAPDSFDTISPFGSRRNDSKAIWWVVISVMGSLALLVMIIFVVKLVTTT